MISVHVPDKQRPVDDECHVLGLLGLAAVGQSSFVEFVLRLELKEVSTMRNAYTLLRSRYPDLNAACKYV